MAELFLASTRGPGGFRKTVALKQILKEQRGDEKFVEAFMDEARLSAALTHPNICQVFELGEEKGELFLAMEFVFGVDLARYVKVRGRGAPLGMVARVARDVAVALSFAHELTHPTTGERRGVIHRDINPRNVMVGFDGLVKVVDFGLARFQDRRSRTEVGVVRGTPQYMAPEQLQGFELDARTDFYGLGVLMWELLTGAHFARNDLSDVVARLRAGQEAPSLSVLHPEVPEPLSGIIQKCLRTRPDERYQSALELSRAISRCGVELFDDAELADELEETLPKTKALVTRLHTLSQQENPDVASIAATVKQLRTADLARPPTTPTTRTEDDVEPPTVIGLPSSGKTVERVVVRSGPPPLLWAIAALAVALGSAAIWFQLARRPPPETRADEATVETHWRVRQLLAEGNPLEAQQVLNGCRGARGKCQGLQALKAEVEKTLEKSPCGTDDKAKSVIAACAGLAKDLQLQLLQECRAGRTLHPLAAQAIAALERSP